MPAPMDGELTEDAVRWLRRSYHAGALVDALEAVGMAVPALYGPTLRFDREFRRDRPEFSYALRTRAPLMAGWTVLLLWADRRPLERRGVLPFLWSRPTLDALRQSTSSTAGRARERRPSVVTSVASSAMDSST